MLNDDENSDRDSLFGSPTLVPQDGDGKPSELALPSAGINSENVGTIALLGSQSVSELDSNSPALSVRASESLTRPPAFSLVEDPSFLQDANRRTRRSKHQAGTAKGHLTAATPTTFPKNYLRNSQTLLGTAGVVGRVNHSRRVRGCSRGDPILVHDHINPPPVGTQGNFLPIDSSLLPQPSNEAIAASMIRQRNIYPVLASILKLMGADPSGPIQFPPRRTGFERDIAPSLEPQVKRRKLNIPAGANDWDVPFPFPVEAGQCQEEYQRSKTNWEKNQGKKLMKQLAGLIKSAANKAATINYCAENNLSNGSLPSHQVLRVRNHYRKNTEAYDTPEQGSAYVAVSNHAYPTPSPSASTENDDGTELRVPSQTEEQAYFSFDALVDAFAAQTSPIPNLTTAQANDSGVSTDFNEADYRKLISMLDESCSMPADDAIAMSEWDLESLMLSCSALGSPIPSSAALSPKSALVSLPRPALSDSLIDPDLLALSLTQSADPYGCYISTESETTIEKTPPVSGMSILWDSLVSPFKETLCAATENTLFNSQLSLGQYATPAQLMLHGFPPPKQTLPLQLSSPVQSSPPPAELRYKRCIAGPGAPTGRADDRAELLRKVQERRRELLGAIDRSKVELWETTIEQGVLTHMARQRY